MKSRRAYIDNELSVGSSLKIEAELAHYLQRVLRMRSGQLVELFNGDGFNYSAEILAIGRKSLDINIIERTIGLPSSLLEITLVQALSRGERLDYSLQKATELGVTAIDLVETDRIELRLDPARLSRRMRHWQQVIISACEQCGRSDLPQLSEPIRLTQYLDSPNSSTRLFLDPESGQGFSALTRPQTAIDLIIGPEGGFSETEKQQMQAQGATGLALGPRVLRTETAGPAAIAIVQQLFGDLNPQNDV